MEPGHDHSDSEELIIEEELEDELLLDLPTLENLGGKEQDPAESIEKEKEKLIKSKQARLANSAKRFYEEFLSKCVV